MTCGFAECLIEDRFVQVVCTGTSMFRSPGGIGGRSIFRESREDLLAHRRGRLAVFVLHVVGNEKSLLDLGS